jgi:diguanylate cyclase (GGDEF)-like protein/PAS domain S-box-containing protein
LFYMHHAALSPLRLESSQWNEYIVVALFASLLALIILYYIRKQVCSKLYHPSSKLLFSHMDEGIVIFGLDGQLVLHNDAAAKYGYQINNTSTNGNSPAFFHVNGVTKLPFNLEPLQQLLQGAELTTQELWLVPNEGKAGSIVRITGKPILTLRKLEGYMLVIHDITQSKWAEKRLEVSEQRFKSLYEHNPDIVFWFNLDGQLLSVNPAMERITGFTWMELKGKTFDDLISHTINNFSSDPFSQLKAGHTLNGETTFAHKSGTTVYLQTTVIPITVEQQLVGVYVIAQDITAKKQSMDTIRHIAYFDTLTGLPNRHHFFETLTETLNSCTHADTEQSFSLLFVDLDRFKLINDSLGHQAGDWLLRQTAMRMQDCIGSKGIISRLSGDEFIILLAHSDAEEAEQLALHVQETVIEPVLYENHIIHTTVSIGISLYPDHGTELEQLVQYADIAMYRVKEQGKNGMLFFNAEMNEAIIRRTTMEKELREALTNKEFTLHYQPQADAATGRITGVEALVRWEHPERGLISPVEFIPLAEETGMITKLGEWVLREACFQTKGWINEGLAPITIAVNISMKQFQDEGLFETIRLILVESQLPPSLLELEITESIGLQGTEQVIQKLHKLKTLGVRIAIDDFGTGYSSLHYLQKLPLDTLKIDKSFIREMSKETTGSSIVHSIIELAHSLKLDVLAEGVELISQHAQLAAFGCDRLQGYLFSRPVAAEQIRSLLALEILSIVHVESHV